MKITVNNTEITLKKSFRSLIAYESATGKAFNPSTITDYITYFYCVVIASAPNAEITFDDFMDYLDENENALNEFTQWIVKMAENEGKIVKKKAVRTKKGIQ